MSEGWIGIGCPGYLFQHDGVSLESTAKQNCDMLRGPNYGVTQVQCAALSTADRTLLMGHAGAKEHGETQGGLLNE